MGLFEALAAVSVTLGLAIPVFMDKVMRPRYEERFYEYRTKNREQLVKGLQATLDKLKKTAKSKRELDPEITESLDSLFPQLASFTAEENKLDSLLNWRKILFGGWMLSLFSSLWSIEFSEKIVYEQVTLGGASIAVFGLSLLASVGYVWELFKLDEKLSKFRSESSSVSRQRSTREIIKEYELEQNVYHTLNKWGALFERSPRVKINGKIKEIDFVVPAAKNPKYLIETKLNLSSPFMLKYLARIGQDLKNHYPRAKTILITKKVPSLPSFKNKLSESWDFLVDIDNLKELRKIIQLKDE